MIMIYASIKGTMDDLLPITGPGRADNINFLSNPTQDASLLRVLTFGNGNHLLFFRFAGKPHPDVNWRLVGMPSPHMQAGVPSNCSS